MGKNELKPVGKKNVEPKSRGTQKSQVSPKERFVSSCLPVQNPNQT